HPEVAIAQVGPAIGHALLPLEDPIGVEEPVGVHQEIRPLDRKPQRLSWDWFRNSWTRLCGLVRLAPVVPIVWRRSRSTLKPTRWIGACCQMCEMAYDLSSISTAWAGSKRP